MQAKNHTQPQLAIRMQMKSQPLFVNLCKRSKNLYNSANYLVRQEFVTTGNWLQYTTLYHQLKYESVYLALKEISGSQVPQQVLLQVEHNWRSYFNAIKAWEKDPTRFLARPRLPRYKPKNSLHMLIFTGQQVRIRNGEIWLTKNLIDQGFPTFPVGNLPVTAENCTGARLVPFYDRFVLEILYKVKKQFIPNSNHPFKSIGIDLGIANLIATSDGLFVKGGVVKTINQWYNKQLAYYKSLAKKHNQQNSSHRILRMHRVRENKLQDIFHQTSRFIINHCLSNNVTTIVIGYNSGWKQHCNLGKRTNQSFVQIPFHKLVHMLKYKAKLVNIAIIRVSEAYTSQKCNKCGVIDKRNRYSRGLYICHSCGLRINADHNAAINIRNRLPFNNQVVPSISSNTICPDPPDRGGVTPPVATSAP